jgi:hypothetical protein
MYDVHGIATGVFKALGKAYSTLVYSGGPRYVCSCFLMGLRLISGTNQEEQVSAEADV